MVVYYSGVEHACVRVCVCVCVGCDRDKYQESNSMSRL